MTITIAGYQFEGTYNYTWYLRDQSGVYVILTPNSSGNYSVLDAGESGKVKTRVENHDREPCWKRNSNGRAIRYAVYYVSGEWQRKAIEQKVRQTYNPPCGDR